MTLLVGPRCPIVRRESSKVAIGATSNDGNTGEEVLEEMENNIQSATLSIIVVVVVVVVVFMVELVRSSSHWL
jgi:hypothetical protein